MRLLPLFFLGCSILAVAACVGGPGPLPSDQGSTEGNTSGAEATTATNQGGRSSSSSGATTTSGGSGGGATSTLVSIASYDTSCNADSDCVPVFAGDACGGCQCPTSAINTKDYASYVTAYSKAKQACSSGNSGAQCDCAQTHATCDTGTKKCTLSTEAVSSGDAG